MRFSRLLVSVLVSVFLFGSVSLTAAFAADLKVRVVDPQSAAVFGAQVELLPEAGASPSAVETTSAAGLAIFHDVPGGRLRVRVLAAGFGEQVADVTSTQDPTTVQVASGSDGRNRRGDGDPHSGSRQRSRR